MRAIILAGGTEDGLSPLTLDIPTAALSVAGKPLVARTLDYLEQQGLTGTIISCYRSPHLIERAIERRHGHMPVRTAIATPPFGTANLVRQLASNLEEPFMVVIGDILTDLDLKAATERHRRLGAMATVLTVEVESPCRHCEVAIDSTGAVVMMGSEQLVQRAGKRLIDTGIYILEPEVLQYVPQDRSSDLGLGLLPLLIERELPVYASQLEGLWFSLGSPNQYRAANIAVLQGRAQGMAPEGEEVSIGIWMGVGTKVDPGAILTPPILIGKGCRVERDAVIGPDTVLGDGVCIKRGGAIKRTVVLPGSRVGLATKLEDSVVRGNVLARAASLEPTYVDDRQVLETLEPVGFDLALRSVIDRTVALLILIICSPLFVLIALLIKLDSRGPIFYSQLRVGQGKRTASGQYQGRVFELHKFRTMYPDSDRRLQEVLDQNAYGSSTFVKIKDDPRITRVGRFLRATSLDEVPQLLNVLKGDIGLVGNRPLPLYEAEQLADDWQRIRFNAPAGITGLWQISGRSDLSVEERIILDNYYALTRSLWSDLKILLMTIPVVLERRGAR